MTISQNFVNLRPSLLLDFANSQQLDPRITFSRPTTAAYYDANTTALAEQNLLTYSQDFTNGVWIKGTTTVTANSTTAPDGTTTASTINPAGAGGTIYQQPSGLTLSVGAISTMSVYLKAGTETQVFFAFIQGASSRGSGCTIDLSAGTAGAITNYGGTTGSTVTVTSVGNGWYRCIFNVNITVSGTQWTIYLTNTTSTNNFFMWGAQLEQHSSVTAYNVTTTAAITNYIPVLLTAPTNQARFDHDPVARTSLGLLIEQQSTNLLTWSSDYTNAAWAKSGSPSITATATIAPDGTQTAQLYVKPVSAGAGTWAYVNQNATISNSASYTLTLYVKSAGLSTVRVQTSGAEVEYTFSSNTFTFNTGGTNTATSVGNGWVRLSITYTSNSTTGANIIGNRSDAGNGYSGIYIWGAQMEALAFPTSYIPTVASQVTRSADNASMTGTNLTSWYQQGSAGTFYLAGDYVQQTGNVGAQMAITDGTTNNRFQSIIVGTQANAMNVSIVANGVIIVNTNVVITASTKIKSAFSINSTTFNIGQNGNTATGSISNPLPTGINILWIGQIPANPVWANAHISKIAYYPIFCTSAQLQSLTGS